jgi:hypothetical protein
MDILRLSALQINVYIWRGRKKKFPTSLNKEKEDLKINITYS